MDILISIIIPVYNVEAYLDRCIKSLINQTYKNLEIILVNDGSKDNSGLICDSYARKDNRIEVYHIENGGSSIARNFGLKKSHGEYIGFVDSDDWVKPEMFEQLINFAIKNNLKVVETSSVHSHLINENTDNNISAIAKVEDKNAALKRIIKNKRFAVWRRIYHHSILQDRYFIEGVLHQDVYYTLDIINDVSKIGYFENQHYVYNVQNPTSVIRSDYSIKKLNSINAGEYVIFNTIQYSNDVQDLAKQFMFEFLTHHYDALYFNTFLDKDGTHRSKIRNTIKKYHSSKNFNFYCFLIITLPPLLYKIFLFTNKKRIKIQSQFSQICRNVQS
ncbi:glycosyltransferase [Winogradskyella forsetii]|uniref:glycosyltransferase n=1 Tax=Winogradskyella forsetii TaxID=2686077 RepID=UPI0015BC6BD1|nr:glycosyltransferase [Winogradskyella forsetii]